MECANSSGLFLNAKDNGMYEKHSLIKPPEDGTIDPAKRAFLYVIDSRERNTELYPSPSSYAVTLDEDVTDVVSARIVDADIPFPRHLVHENNNKLYVTESAAVLNGENTADYEYTNNVVRIEIPTGDYSVERLRQELESQMNANLQATSVTVTHDTLKDKFTFTSSLVNSAGEPLGFAMLFRGQMTYHGSYSTEKVLKTTPNGTIMHDGNGNKMYETIVLGDKYWPLQKGTLARVLGFAGKNYGHTTGLSSTTLGSTVVVGTDTMYTRDYSVGDNVVLHATDGAGVSESLGTVVSIESDVLMTVSIPATSTMTKLVSYSGKITAEFRNNFSKDRYIILKMTGANAIYSNAKNVNQAFALISTDNRYRFDNYPIKFMNPIKPDMRKIKLSFVDYDGNEYDFQNQDHHIEILFTTFKQTRSYENIFKGTPYPRLT